MNVLDISYPLLAIFSAELIFIFPEVRSVMLTIVSVFEQICSSVQFHSRRPWEGESNFICDRLNFLIKF